MSLGKRLFDVVRSNLTDLTDLGSATFHGFRARSEAEPFDDEPLDLEPEPPGLSARQAQWHKDLGIEPGASVEEIRRAYRRQMRQYHPDRFASDPAKLEVATRVARGLTEAYNGLLKLHGG